MLFLRHRTGRAAIVAGWLRRVFHPFDDILDARFALARTREASS